MRARFARIGALGAVVATAHTLVNLRALRVPPPADTATDTDADREPISVLLPVRNEAHRVGPCLDALRAALIRYGSAELVVLDDESTDGTANLVRARAPNARHECGAPLPDGWLGKPHAAAQAADYADPASTALVFLDADVILAPDALVRAVAQLRSLELQLISPYPRQLARTAAERLVQPLLQWSWLTFLPLGHAARSTRASLSAANGQLLIVDTAAYRSSGGHAAVRGEVLDDLALLKAFKRSGFRGTVTDGTELATCRMYDGWPAVRDGYSKSLWSAFGSPAGAAAVCTTLLCLYVAPPLAWLRRPTDAVLAGGTAAGVAGRWLVARRVGGRKLPDSAAHPLSVLVFCALTARSYAGHARGTLTWKDRVL